MRAGLPYCLLAVRFSWGLTSLRYLSFDPHMRTAPALLLLALSACADMPDLPPRPVLAGAAPVILPTDEVLAAVQGDLGAEESGAALAARAAALRARAAGM